LKSLLPTNIPHVCINKHKPLSPATLLLKLYRWK
jgi:hypothetical protein